MYVLMFHDDTIIVDTTKYVRQIMVIFGLLATDSVRTGTWVGGGLFHPDPENKVTVNGLI